MTTRKRNVLVALWDFFCSLKLTIITLILLAVTSIIGTVIQQNKTPQEYLQVYSETTYRLLESLQFFDMYHSWWFLTLLGLLTVNLIACSIKRLPRVLKAVREPVLVPDDSLYRTFSNFEEQVVAEDAGVVRKKIENFLSSNFAAPVVTESDDKIHFFSQKGAYSRFGVYVTHLSIVIIFIGAIIGNVFGYKAYVNIVEGKATNQVWPRGSNEPINLDFAVRCDDFSLSYYEGTSRPKEYKSLLTVLEGGKPVSAELTERPVIVNDPLTYRGIVFYQSSYGTAGDPIFNLRVREKETGSSVQLTARQGQLLQLPGGGSVRVADFTPSYQDFGPAARLEVVNKEGRRNSFVVLQAFPQFDIQRGGDYSFTLVNYEQSFYTGLQVAKDPGVWVVWVGCILMVVGSMAAFFMSHRRVWVTVQPVGKKTGIKFGGAAHRNQPAFEIFFDDFKKKLKTELSS